MHESQDGPRRQRLTGRMLTMREIQLGNRRYGGKRLLYA
jgi:hypothetical protein